MIGPNTLGQQIGGESVSTEQVIAPALGEISITSVGAASRPVSIESATMFAARQAALGAPNSPAARNAAMLLEAGEYAAIATSKQNDPF